MLFTELHAFVTKENCWGVPVDFAKLDADVRQVAVVSNGRVCLHQLRLQTPTHSLDIICPAKLLPLGPAFELTPSIHRLASSFRRPRHLNEQLTILLCTFRSVNVVIASKHTAAFMTERVKDLSVQRVHAPVGRWHAASRTRPRHIKINTTYLNCNAVINKTNKSHTK